MTQNVFGAARVLLLLLMVLDAPQRSAAEIKEVCLTAYVMDTYCIDRTTLLDNPSINTLEGPDKHSIHCLVDVARCYDSGFELLSDPKEGETMHVRAFKLDETGFKKALALARDGLEGPWMHHVYRREID